MVTITHEQNITCSKTLLDGTRYEQTMICRWLFAGHAISFPEALSPLTSGRKLTAVGATISGMRHRYRLHSKTGSAEFGYFLGYFKMVAPRTLVFQPLVKGNEACRSCGWLEISL